MNDQRPFERHRQSGTSVARALGEIEAALRDALEGDAPPPADAPRRWTRRLRGLARAAAALPAGEAHACIETLTRVQALHRRLAVRLSQQRDDAARRLAQLRTGKRSLKAYGQSI